MERILLHYVDGPRKGDVEAFCQPSVVIGRAPDCHLVFPNERGCSAHHAVIRQADGRFELVDSHSTNGTFVNDLRIQHTMLEDGDIVRFGVFGPQLRVAIPSSREMTTARELNVLVPPAPAADAVAGEGAAVAAPTVAEPLPNLQRMRHWRFVRNALVIYVGAALAATQLVDILFDRYRVPRPWFTTFLILVVGGFCVTAIAAAFRGAPGAQRTRGSEVALHALVALVVAAGIALVWLR